MSTRRVNTRKNLQAIADRDIQSAWVKSAFQHRTFEVDALATLMAHRNKLSIKIDCEQNIYNLL